MRPLATWRHKARGSALVEFAICLPLLVVFLVGIYDFSGAFNQKQKIEHAAQAGAMVAGAQPMSDIDANPDSLQPVVAVILNSLAADNVLPQANWLTCTISTASVGRSGPLKWTYTWIACPDLKIEIDRGVPVGAAPPTGVGTVGTSVEVSYPYHWRFNSAIQLLFPGASYTPAVLRETATVQNQL